MDSKHDLACTDCHQGDNRANEQTAAHQGLITSENMTAVCGRCHAKQAEVCVQSAHFTLKNEINLIRSHFGLAPVAGIKEIPDHSGAPQDKEQLVDDLLRRRCLRCHVQTAGDSYPYVRRGTRCAACHLRKTEGKLDSHAFSIPGERQCLSCHYGNRVGSDFAGMYEHDYGSDFRSPQATAQPFLRPYGVEQHDLAQDIHRQRGLTCLDCHSGAELSGKQAAVQCADCHAPETGKMPPLKNVRVEGGLLILTARQDGKEHPIPVLKHPAHAQYVGKVACQVCHGQWSFNDQSTHLLLTYSSDTAPWNSLAIQSNSEAEKFIANEEEPVMSDALTGQKKPGIWLQGYNLRRWERMLIRLDKDGVIKVFRPILDLRLSAVNKDGQVITGLDNITGDGDGLLPYTPHTTGPAGLLYEQRFLHLFDDTAAEHDDPRAAHRPGRALPW
ncbi:hypothetical protein VU06_00070 [Desulfobulbus sp. F3]|nr:hypothetical protein [Desulfobulbus sp. F3]